MCKRLQPIPHFATVVEKRAFCETHNSADYVDWNKTKLALLPNLNPATQTISLRLLPLETIRTAANTRNVSYQSPITIWLLEKVEQH
jgi:hypothetical protein